MEAAVSAYAANSKWCLGLGRRKMGGFGRSKQSSLLLSLSSSIGGGGGGGGCCSWSSRINNKMNCSMRRFRLESTSMGIGAAIERLQSLKGRFVRAEAASALGGGGGGGGEDIVENGDVILPEASIRVAIKHFVREAVSALGGEVVENGNVILPEAFIRVAMQPCVREAFSSLGGEVVENGPEHGGGEDVENGEASIRVAIQQFVSAFGGEVVENGDVILPEASIRVAMQHFVCEAVSAFGGGEVAENGDVIFPEASIRASIRVAMQQYSREAGSGGGGEDIVEDGNDEHTIRLDEQKKKVTEAWTSRIMKELNGGGNFQNFMNTYG